MVRPLDEKTSLTTMRMRHCPCVWLLLLLAAAVFAKPKAPDPVTVQFIEQHGFDPYAESFKSRGDSVLAARFWYDKGKRWEEKRYLDVDSIQYAYARANGLNPRDVDIAMTRSYYLFRYRHNEEAMACLVRALEFEPANAAVWEAKAKLHLAFNEFPAAETSYREIVNRQPKRREEILRVLINNAERMEDQSHAERLYREAQNYLPHRAWVWSDYGNMLFWQPGRRAEGLTLIERGIALEPDSAHSRITRASALAEEGRFTEAVKEWDKVIELEPDPEQREWYRGIRADLQTLLGNNRSAERDYGEVVKADPDDGHAWFELGRLGRELNRPLPEQLEAFEQTIRINNTDVWAAWFGKSCVLRDLGRTDEAEAAYDNAVGDALGSAADIPEMRDSANLARTVEYLRWAATRVDGHGTASAVLVCEVKAGLLLTYGRHAEALSAADSCILHLEESDNAWRFKGEALLSAGCAAEARDAFSQAIAMRPHKGRNWNGLGRAEFAQANWTAAAAACSTAFALDPADGPARRILGYAQYYLGNYAEAIQSLKGTTGYDAEGRRVHYFLTRAYSRLAQRREALAHLRALLRAEPAYRDSVRADDAFRQLEDDLEFEQLLSGSEGRRQDEIRIIDK